MSARTSLWVIAVALVGCQQKSPHAGASSAGSAGASEASASASGTSGSSHASGSTHSSSTGGSTGHPAASGGASGNATGGSTGANSGAAAGSSGASGVACPAGLTSVTLSPATLAVALDGGSPADITFTVQGDVGGTTEAIPSSLFTWTVTRADDTSPGTIADGVLSPYGGAGGVVTVTATGCGQTATATVTLTLSEALSSDGGDPGAFGGTTMSGSANGPTLVYPSAETRFPRNVYDVTFQWQPSGSTQFRLTFTGSGSVVTVYTDGQGGPCAGVANASCWQADRASWEAIAGSNAGGTVQVEVDGTASAGSTVYLGTPETIAFSKRDVPGAIFYWAANRGGIERATVSDSAPQDYLVGPQPGGGPNSATVVDGYSVQCAACHTVSRDGQKMAASMQAQGPTNVHGLWTMQVTATPPPNPIATAIPAAAGDGFSAFSPDTTKLVWGPRNGGQLELVDSASGDTIAAVAVGGTVVQGSSVDWAPDAGLIAYADTKGGISTVQVDATGTVFTNPTQIVASGMGMMGPMMGPGGGQNIFPMFDPEGDEIAYSDTADLFLVAPTGGTPVELTAANTVVNNSTSMMTLPKENNMPTWAPPGDLHWVAFNSQRPYGLLTNGANNQIWVAAVDLTKLPADPSYPAFWLPFQNLTDLNHRAFWTLDVRTELDAGAPEDAGPPVDAGQPDAGHPPEDAGPPVDAGQPPGCVPLGHACQPATSTCCDPNLSGNYCGIVEDAGYACVITFD